MSIHLIRHGETELNAARVLQPADTPLSDRGRAQAARLAGRLKAVGVGLILSSDLPRALQTAGAIAAATGAPVATTPLLQERNFGDLRGLAYDVLPIDPIHSEAAPPGGESMVQFSQRVDRAWAEIIGSWRQVVPGRHLAVVSHGLVVRLLLARFTDQPPAHLGNTSLSTLDEVDDSLARGTCAYRFVASRINSLSHLQASEGDDPDGLSGG